MKKTPKMGNADTTYSLKKSVKELRCLYDVARITGASEMTLNERFAEIVKILPPAFTHPATTCARIIIGWLEFKTDNYTVTDNSISADIMIRGTKSGWIEIGSYRTFPFVKSFSVQEILLLHAVAERVSSIMEHRRAEDALRESEEKFSKAFHSSPAIISISDLEDGWLIDVNDSFERYTGYTREEALKLTSIEAGRWAKAEDRTLFVDVLKTKGKVRDLEIVSRTKNGELRTGLISADLINIGGNPCIISVTQDITEQKHAQEFTQSISNASPLGIYITQDEKLTYVNPQFQKITGYNQREMLGLSLLKVVAAEDTDVVRSSIMYSLKGENPYPCEYRILNKNGQTKWVMQTVSPMHFNGREALLGNVMDITERKYLERKVIEYEELNKMKTDLLSTVSHELRTPLAAIKGYTTMILDYSSRINAEEIMDHLKTIDNSANILITMVDNLLDTSRIDSGLLHLDKNETDIIGLVRSVVKDMSRSINRHNIITKLPKTLLRISIDAKRIKQVLENIIDNAAKFSPEGTDILISAKKNRLMIEISVTDRGSGIPAGELENIFERMYNIEKRTETCADGMGLSLYICKELIEAHGGLIWVESKPGQGSSFHFSLPVNSQNNRSKV